MRPTATDRLLREAICAAIRAGDEHDESKKPADFVRGHTHYAGGEYEQAVEAFTRLNQSQNPYWKHYGISYLSEILIELGRWQKEEDSHRYH